MIRRILNSPVFWAGIILLALTFVARNASAQGILSAQPR